MVPVQDSRPGPKRRQPDTVTMLGAGHTIRVETGRRVLPAPAMPADASIEATRILGLDLAMGTTGWCLLVGGRPEAHGSFDLPGRPHVREGLASFLRRRADELARQVGLLVRTHRPEIVGYEYPDLARPHYSGGSKGREFAAVQGLSRAEGFLIARWDAIGGDARLVAVPMSEAKRLVAGRPGATKDQVAWALVTYRQWNLRGWTPDQVDAAAVALAAREML